MYMFIELYVGIAFFKRLKECTKRYWGYVKFLLFVFFSIFQISYVNMR